MKKVVLGGLGVIGLIIGIVLIVMGVNSMTSFVGMFYSWKPPFSEYEIQVLTELVGGIILAVVGGILVIAALVKRS